MLRKEDRLTRYIGNGTVDVVCHGETTPCNTPLCPYYTGPEDKALWPKNIEYQCSDNDACDYSILVKHLAAYEDTRMTPDEIMKMKVKVKRLSQKVKDLKASLKQGNQQDLVQ